MIFLQNLFIINVVSNIQLLKMNKTEEGGRQPVNIITEAEVHKLSVMYEGDKNRDATDKIRGYLFQDYVAIMCLLKEQVECVCLEYIEDVDVFWENGKFEFIQVKYYPNSDLAKKEVFTDLYYQYLRLKVLKSNMKIMPCLYIHREKKVEKPTIEDMENYIGLGNGLPKEVKYPSIEDSVEWLKENVYKTNKKDMQKKSLFEKMASEKSIQEFVAVAQNGIFCKPSIDKYKEELMKALEEAYSVSDTKGQGEKAHWQSILLGLAMVFIQRRYMLVNPHFNELKFDKKEFDQYMKEHTDLSSNKTITSYLISIVCKKYENIIKYNNTLKDLQVHILYLIYQNSLQWIGELGDSVDGQYQLLNTVSFLDASGIADYKELSIDDKLLCMAESKLGFEIFLGYLWKIILNICQDKISSESEISHNMELFNPAYYVDTSVNEYICLNFQEDKYVNHSIILPGVGDGFNSAKRKIVERMLNVEIKPEKWFLQDSKLKVGKNYYDYSTANVNEKAKVTDLGCHASNYCSHLRQLYRRLNSAFPIYCLS